MLDIICRDRWYALPHARTTFMTSPAQTVFLMNTHTKPCRHRVYCNGMVRRVQEFNINIQRMADIRYNFIIGGDATVYEGRGWALAPELPRSFKSYSLTSIVIAYLGTYTASTVPKPMAQAAVELVKLGVKDGMIAKHFQYRDITITEKRSLNPDLF
ncbi:peptidoglycan recognition protein 1-like [Macrosteles quadrilineatus]|uniref:peptidoglycan recognition protein 1-like n=1 Tax=Macrosteles quadrilineatus TaxID=74068 RepID=UPI0023E0DF9F|nr:peptidoglycan recognition protein 1-like [Macrosteles quadrilineatus]XP_054264608.1 peptidoglycan recognition protein 1-like [Macrosteles quadrilineatus]